MQDLSPGWDTPSGLRARLYVKRGTALRVKRQKNLLPRKIYSHAGDWRIAGSRVRWAHYVWLQLSTADLTRASRYQDPVPRRIRRKKKKKPNNVTVTNPPSQSTYLNSRPTTDYLGMDHVGYIHTHPISWIMDSGPRAAWQIVLVLFPSPPRCPLSAM